MTPLKDVKVLVVDDNPLVLDLVVKGLAPHCETCAASDATDALLKIVFWQDAATWKKSCGPSSKAPRNLLPSRFS
jgi:hypothetical protein